jgi:hypothetical protein
MREIVRTQSLQALASALGDDAVLDAATYDDVVARHWKAFDEFCASRGAETAFNDSGQQPFDTAGYVAFNEKRRGLLNDFIREKPHVVVAGERRFFSVALRSEVEVTVHELSADEMAEALNELLRRPTLLEALRRWYRLR